MKHMKVTPQTALLNGFYSLDLKKSQANGEATYCYCLTTKIKPGLFAPETSTSDAGLKSVGSLDGSIDTVFGKSDLADLLFGAAGEAGENFDLPISDDLFNLRIKQFIGVGGPDSTDRDTLLHFFRVNTISDEVRKHVWKIKISNALGITSELFEILKQRLKEDGLKKSVDKLILDDLNRTLPEYKEHAAGLAMFESVRQLLSLWHIYRPDFGYIQGMSYLMVMLFYYYEEFECFVLFSNLILTREVFSNCYSFSLSYVIPDSLDPSSQRLVPGQTRPEVLSSVEGTGAAWHQLRGFPGRLGLHRFHENIQHKVDKSILGPIPYFRRLLPDPAGLCSLLSAQERPLEPREHGGWPEVHQEPHLKPQAQPAGQSRTARK